MYITFLGHSCFKLESKERQVVLITDPFDKSIGLNVPKMCADIITISHKHNDHANSGEVKGVDGKPFIIDLPGEYEVKGVFIYGIPSFHDNENGSQRGENTIYKIIMEGISIAHLGDLGHSLSNDAVEQLDGVDVLLIPVGGNYTIGAKEANQIISQLEPRIVIPMHYKVKGLKIDIEPADLFLKEMGITNPKVSDKLKITKKDLPQGVTEIIVMK